MLLAQGCNPGSNDLNLANCLILNRQGQTVAEVYSTPSVIVSVFTRNLFVIAGVIFFMLIIFSGYKFIRSGTKGKDEAKQILTTAVSGYVIMFAAYWIVQILEVVTGAEILL